LTGSRYLCNVFVGEEAGSRPVDPPLAVPVSPKKTNRTGWINYHMLHPQLTAQQAVVQYGPFELEGFMLPSGEFRQSLSSTARAVGMKWGGYAGRLIQEIAAAEACRHGQDASIASDLSKKSQNDARGIVAVNTGLSGLPNVSQAKTIDLATANAFWAHVGLNASNVEYRQNAINLLAAGSKVTLEQAYCEAFGVAKDGRSISDQVLEAWLDLDNMTRRRLSSPQLLKQAKRVTGHDLLGKNPYCGVIWSELIWHRMPENIHRQMQELNPVVSPIFTKPDGTKVGWRRYAYAEMLSEPAFERAAAPIISAATMCLTMSPDKEAGERLKSMKSSFQFALKQLDTLYPRFKNRAGRKPGASNPNQLTMEGLAHE